MKNQKLTGKEMRDLLNLLLNMVCGWTTPVGERVKRVGELFVGLLTNLVANVGIDGAAVENSFDKIDIFQTELAEVAGNTMVKRRLYFYKLEFVKEGGVDYEYHWMCAVKLAGYIRPRIFIDDAGEEIDFAYLSAYEASEDVSPKVPPHPRIGISRNNARISARKNDGNGTNTDSRWGIMDLAEYQYHIVIPFEIEFATRNSQAVLVGVSGLSYSGTHEALTAETGNIIVITNAQAASYVVGQTIAIGASLAVAALRLIV